jgi:hypothetical protein
MTDSENDPALQRKARRTIRLLYFMMAVMILAPLVLWWILER